jgi:hypothetical protein
MEKTTKWLRAELLIFTIFAILNLLPFVSTRFFPSMDGASHLYNSNIINQLFFYNNALFHQFFMINPEPVPNWISHLAISLLTLIMPAFLAEKFLLIVILAGTPFAFRGMMHTLTPKNTLYSFLIFPFTHSMFFFFGFFNFCMGILFFFITLNYWLKHDQRGFGIPEVILLMVLIALTYFSHIVIFGILLIAIAVHIIARSVKEGIYDREEIGSVIRKFLKKTLLITLASLVPLILFVYFFYSRPGTREITYISRSDLISYLVTIRPLISLNPIIEGRETTWLFYLFVFLAGSGAVGFVIRLIKQHRLKHSSGVHPEAKILPGFHFWWLLATMTFLLLLYFSLPDAYGTASYTNLRIGLFFFLFLILFFATFRIPWYFGLIAAIGALYVNTTLIRYYTPHINDLSKLAVACNKASDHVAPNSLVLPIYCMDNWFTGHFVDYLAIDKPVVMVYNYECESGYFPVIWNEAAKPNYHLGNPDTPERHISFELVKGRPSLALDYVFILGQYDPGKDWFFTTLHKILTDDFTRVYETDNCSLYRNKFSRTRSH